MGEKKRRELHERTHPQLSEAEKRRNALRGYATLVQPVKQHGLHGLIVTPWGKVAKPPPRELDEMIAAYKKELPTRFKGEGAADNHVIRLTHGIITKHTPVGWVMAQYQRRSSLCGVKNFLAKILPHRAWVVHQQERPPSYSKNRVSNAWVFDPWLERTSLWGYYNISPKVYWYDDWIWKRCRIRIKDPLTGKILWTTGPATGKVLMVPEN